MPKPTPNPPESTTTPHNPSTLFHIAPNIRTEDLLSHACESLASASVMASDLATFLNGPHRSTLLGIQQVIMLADLAVMDNLDPQG